MRENVDMPGTLAVAGTFPIARRGVVVYGEVIAGDVRAGEVLTVPLNGGTSTSAVIRSVEAVDRPETGVHVGLLLSNDEPAIDLLRGVALDGQTLIVSSPEVDEDAGGIGFDEAKRRLVDLLLRVQRPREIAWVDESHITRFPDRVFVFLRRGQFEPEHVVRAKYRLAAAKCPAVRLGAVGTVGTMSLVAVWPICELGAGEEMFIEEGVKIDVPAADPVVTITTSRVTWWVIRRAYRKWIERRDAALRTAR